MDRMQYKEIIENISDWVWAVDANGVYTYCSDNVCDFLGYSAQEMIGRTPFDFMSAQEAKRVGALFGTFAAKKEKIVNLKNTNLHKNGSVIVVETSAIPLLDEDGNLLGYQGIDKDITKFEEAAHELSKQKELYELVFNKTLSGVLILDIEENKFIDCNQPAINILQYDSKENLLNQHPSELSPKYQPDGRLSSEKSFEMNALAVKNGSHTFEWVHLTKTQQEIWIEVILTPIALDEKNVLHAIWKDISQRKEAEIELANQLSLLNNIIDTVPVRIFWKDKKGVYLGANTLFLGDAQLASSDEIIGKNDFEMPWGKTEGQLYRDDDLEVMSSEKSKLNIEETQTNEQGGVITLLTSKVPLKDAHEKVVGVLGTYTDISTLRNAESELKKQKDILAHQAYHDALTGLPNRLLFNDRLEQNIERIKRSGNKLALFFIDLDHFKEINDSLGHAVGDEILKIVAQRLREITRHEDTISRFGGDEFTIIIENLKQLQDISLFAQKIIEELAKPIVIDENVLYVSSSIGISLSPDDSILAQDLLKYADSAMYKAKDEGRNNFQYYSAEMTELAFERVVMEASLRQALQKKEFVVYYQPQVNGKTEKIIGMEALVRWEHPIMGLVSPDKFIPLAESTGLIIELDQFVMKTAMKQFGEWYEKGLNPGVLALNLAIKQLSQKNCIYTLENIIKEAKCKTSWIELEITEGQIMKNPEEAIQILNQLSDLGIELAVDDFGTGYSSLSYLKKLPIKKLKIDKSFVDGLPYDEEDSGISKAIVSLAQSLNLHVIAEGVETKEQKDFLVQNGCENIQGYFYAKPMPAKAMEEFLKKGL
jgi:diguanylate cyclase (GGDEF)-like protein/PAS domain S-box-containing protein